MLENLRKLTKSLYFPARETCPNKTGIFFSFYTTVFSYRFFLKERSISNTAMYIFFYALRLFTSRVELELAGELNW